MASYSGNEGHLNERFKEQLSYMILHVPCVVRYYLVNADESGYEKSNIRNVMDGVFKTSAGKMLLQSVYGIV